MKYLLLTIFSGVLFFACKSKNKIPGDILPKEKMQAILGDMMRADQFLTNYVLNKDSSLDKTVESIKYYQRVLSIHQVDKKEFQKSFSYYQLHPELLRDIMDSLSRPPQAAPAKIISPVIEDTLKTIRETGPKTKDSAMRLLRKSKTTPGN